MKYLLFPPGLFHREEPKSIKVHFLLSDSAFSYVNKGEIELNPIVAEINADACTWCSACANACPFNAIGYDEKTTKAMLTNSLCKGCGMCTPACSTRPLCLITPFRIPSSPAKQCLPAGRTIPAPLSHNQERCLRNPLSSGMAPQPSPPHYLLSAEDVQKVERRLKAENKKVLKNRN